MVQPINQISTALHTDGLKEDLTPVIQQPHTSKGSVFHKDTLSSSEDKQKHQDQVKAPTSWWNTVISKVSTWFSGSKETTPVTQTEIAADIDRVNRPTIQPINSIPVIEKPSSPPTTTTQLVLEGKEPLKFETEKKDFSKMTTEQLYVHAIKAGIDINELSGAIAIANSEQFHELAVFTREKLQKALEKMESNKSWSSFFSSAQWITGAASVLCLAAPMIAPVFGATGVAATILAGLSTTGAAVTAGLGVAVTKTGEAFFRRRSNENSAEKTEEEWMHEIMTDGMSRQSQIINDTTEEITRLQELLFESNRAHDRKVQLFIRK